LIAVTGAAGFIGSALVWALNQQGRTDIIAVDQLGRDDKWKNLRGLSFDDYLEHDDFLSRVGGDKPLPELEAILHMGACSATTEQDCSFLIKNNFEYTKALAGFAVVNGIRFIYASSAATYGDGSQGFSDHESGLTTLTPLNMYGYSKHLFDLWAWRRGLLERFVGLKYFNVFGPNEYHKGPMRSFALTGFEQLKTAQTLKLFKSFNPAYADGEQVRDFIYIKDAVAMTLFFLERQSLGGIYNIGTGQARTWNDLALAMFAALDRQPSITYIDMPDGLKDRYQYFTQADITKLRQAGYTAPITSLAVAVQDYITQYLLPGNFLATQKDKASAG
jgi:ADP-L-glycero-D-manno-heptose 6-epimerase